MPTGHNEATTGARLLRTGRSRAGLSQEELARRAGVSPRTVRQIEAGRCQPRPATLKSLSEALGLSGAQQQDFMRFAPVQSLDEDTVVPRQLPAQPAEFIGRGPQLQQLDCLLRSSDGGLAVVSGAAGAGKTWLLLRWAYANLERFGDGQLYVNLRGSSTQPALPVATALRHLLESLGVTGDEMPRDMATQAALFRSLLARKRMLVVLDDAADAAQLEPLLPSGPQCVTVVTSRNTLCGWRATHGARHINMPTMTTADAYQVLAARVGQSRAVAEPAAVERLLRYTAGSPLAIALVAARALAQPGLALRALAEELAEESTRLSVIDAGIAAGGMRDALRASYDGLSPRAGEVFALLGAADEEYTAPGVALAAGLSLTATRRALRELCAAHMLEQTGWGRYRIPELPRLLAAELAAARQPRSRRGDWKSEVDSMRRGLVYWAPRRGAEIS